MKWLDKAKAQEPILNNEWFKKQDDLFNSRVTFFQSKCITEYEAKCLALELYLRDYGHLKEVHCFECQNLKGSPFFECVKDKSLSLNLKALHKCSGFIPLEYGEIA